VVAIRHKTRLTGRMWIDMCGDVKKMGATNLWGYIALCLFLVLFTEIQHSHRLTFSWTIS